jgi:hypothetical protein
MISFEEFVVEATSEKEISKLEKEIGLGADDGKYKVFKFKDGSVVRILKNKSSARFDLYTSDDEYVSTFVGAKNLISYLNDSNMVVEGSYNKSIFVNDKSIGDNVCDKRVC